MQKSSLEKGNMRSTMKRRVYSLKTMSVQKQSFDVYEERQKSVHSGSPMNM